MAPYPASSAALPEPIYWKQHLFLIPYRWGSAAEPGAAQAVWLFVSKDRGASWQKISEAKPDVKSFNYRAEADGEYWFAVRTFDKQGRAWPQGPYQPELRVIVDTTAPRIDELRARLAENGVIEIHTRATDLNLDPRTWKFEWQTDPAAAWQAVILHGAGSGEQGAIPQQPPLLPAPGSLLHAYWQPPGGSRPIAIRGIIADRAGNSATYQTRVESGPVMSGPLLTPPVVSNVATPGQIMPTQPASGLPTTNPQTNASAQGWLPQVPAAAQPAQAAAPPASQPWPAGNVARAPFRLWTSGTVQQDDGVTAYGSPPLFGAPPSSVAQNRRGLAHFAESSEQNVPGTIRSGMVPLSADGSGIGSKHEEPRTEARFAGIAKPSADSPSSVVPTSPSRPQFTTLEPYREPSTDRPAAPAGNDASVSVSKPTARDVTPVDSPAAQHSPSSPPKLVGSRTFALEYDLDDAGRGGVSKVELWGTRDGGQTWSCYAQDDDNRSPLIVTVDDEGLYGFRILVQIAGGAAAEPPRSGDAPELWVSVDLKRPVVELTAIERGQGNLADHLNLRWRAADNNLEPRPIALFYSSRPAGPWSAIATNLENTGEYAWRVERYVPARFYLRIEAHDTAGNLAAFQTREPVEFSPANLAGRLRSAEPAGNTATGGSDSYR